MYTKAFLEAVEELKKEKKKKAKEQFYRKIKLTFIVLIGFNIGLSSYLAYPGVVKLLTKPALESYPLSHQPVKGEVIASASESGQMKKDQESLSCPVGFNFFEGSFFSLCYPSYLNQIYQKEDKITGEIIEVIFSNDQEELIASFDQDRMWNIHLCNVSKQIEIGGLSATRTALKMEDEAGCNKVKGYVTKINYPEKQSFFLKMIKLNGYFEDNSEFLLTEKSLKLIK